MLQFQTFDSPWTLGGPKRRGWAQSIPRTARPKARYPRLTNLVLLPESDEMHSVDLLEEALALASDSGFEVRQEWLNEQGGGACRIGQQWVLFVDLSLSASEQLEQVLAGLIKSGQCRQQDTTSPDLAARLHAAPRTN